MWYWWVPPVLFLFWCLFLSISHVMLTRVEALDTHIDSTVLRVVQSTGRALKGDYDTVFHLCLRPCLDMRPWWIPSSYVRRTVDDLVQQYVGRWQI